MKEQIIKRIAQLQRLSHQAYVSGNKNTAQRIDSEKQALLDKLKTVKK